MGTWASKSADERMKSMRAHQRKDPRARYEIALVRANKALGYSSFAPESGGTYSIDPSNVTGKATDSGPGSAVAPWLTTSPLAALPPLTAPTDLFILSDFPSDAPVWQMQVSGDVLGSLWVHGTKTVLRTGVLTSAVPFSETTPAGGQPLLVTDATGAFDWSPYVGVAFFELLSGPHAGYIAPIRGAPSVGTGRLGALGNPNPFGVDVGPINPIGNENYRITRPTSIPGFAWEINGPGNFVTNRDAIIVTDCATKNPTSISSAMGGTSSRFSSCILGATIWGGVVGVNIQNCIVTGAHTVATGFAIGNGGCGYQCFVSANPGAAWRSDDWGMEASEMGCAPGGLIDLLTIDAFNCFSPIIVEGVCRLTRGHILWGSGNTSTAIAIYAGGKLQNGNGYVLNIIGTGVGYSDFLLDGASSTTFVRNDNGAFTGPIACSFANLALPCSSGGFGGSVQNLLNGAAIIASAQI